MNGSMCAGSFHCDCLGSCFLVWIPVWLFGFVPSCADLSVALLGSCSGVRIPVWLFGLVLSCADFSEAVWVRAVWCGFQCGCMGAFLLQRIPVWLFGFMPLCADCSLAVWRRALVSAANE